MKKTRTERAELEHVINNTYSIKTMTEKFSRDLQKNVLEDVIGANYRINENGIRININGHLKKNLSTFEEGQLVNFKINVTKTKE